MQDDLIYDVGAHVGYDTAYYLSRGFRVVAVEAYPDSVTILREKFRSSIESGRLAVVALAVGTTAGEIDLFMSRSSSGSNSIFADEVDDISGTIKVPCIPFCEILRHHGVPYYLKVDIQGADGYVLESLDPHDLPAYLSWEMDRDQLRALATVHALGYRRFKLIDQHTFLEMERKYALRHRMIRKLRSVSGRVGLAKTRDPEWRFTMHSSGPFGEDTNGHWCSYERVRGQWERFIRLHPSRKEQPGWYDCHAAM